MSFLIVSLHAKSLERCQTNNNLTNGKYGCVSMLYALTAEHAQIKRLNQGLYSIVLQQVSDHFTYFSDRPKRIAGSNSTINLWRNWGLGKDSFEQVPPNAVIEGIDMSTMPFKQHSYVFELYKPQYNLVNHQLDFSAKAVGKHVQHLHAIQLDDVAVFIDYWGGGFG